MQRNSLGRFTRTVMVIPLTTNLRRAQVPGTVTIPAGEGGLNKDSVGLCYQIAVLDQERLLQKLGTLSSQYLIALENALRYTLQLDSPEDDRS